MMLRMTFEELKKLTPEERLEHAIQEMRAIASAEGFTAVNPSQPLQGTALSRAQISQYVRQKKVERRRGIPFAKTPSLKRA